MRANRASIRIEAVIVPRRVEDRIHAHLLKRHASPRLRALMTNIDICASLIFPCNKPRIVLVPPFVSGRYDEERDTVYVPVETKDKPADEQRELIFHEFRHRIVTAGQANPLTDFSRFREFVPADIELYTRAIVEAAYVPERNDKEVDAYITSCIAVQAFERDGIFAARRMLFASRPEDFYWPRLEIRMLSELAPSTRFTAPRTVLATANIPYYLRPISS